MTHLSWWKLSLVSKRCTTTSLITITCCSIYICYWNLFRLIKIFKSILILLKFFVKSFVKLFSFICELWTLILLLIKFRCFFFFKFFLIYCLFKLSVDFWLIVLFIFVIHFKKVIFFHKCQLLLILI